MPANLTPEYKAAEAEFRRATEPADRLHWLREMLRTIPKHKGTEHLRADIKTRIKELSSQLAGPKKTGARTGPPTVIRPDGAAQVGLLGPPNSGKSTLHARLTGSHAEVGPYPFTTQFPQPGMFAFEDVSFQLIDLPPLSTTRPVPWIGNALQPADAALLVVDLGDPDCVEAVLAIVEMLAERRVVLTEQWAETPEEDELDPFTVVLPTLMLANKADLIDDLTDELQAFRDLSGLKFPVIATSVVDGTGLDEIGPWLFRGLGIVRVYTKRPGKSADLGRPYTVRSGQTIEDVAYLVHRDIAGSLKYARLWGDDSFDGQQVGRDHEVADGDIVELHA